MPSGRLDTKSTSFYIGESKRDHLQQSGCLEAHMIPLVDSHEYVVGLAGVRCSQPPRHAMKAVVPVTQGDEATQHSLAGGLCANAVLPE